MRKELEVLLETVEGIEKRPGMYLLHRNYVGLASYLDGYFWALKNIYGIPYYQHFGNWLAGESNAIAWSHYILIKFADGDEELAYKLIIEKLKQFIRQYPHPN